MPNFKPKRFTTEAAECSRQSTQRKDFNLESFSAALYDKMRRINPGIENLALYEFRYGLNNLALEGGWASVELDAMAEIEKRTGERSFTTASSSSPKWRAASCWMKTSCG